MKRIYILLFVFFVSCVPVSRKNYVYFSLEPVIKSTQFNNKILINSIKVIPPYNTKYIYYSYRKMELQPYSYHLWASPLSDMLLNIFKYDYINFLTEDTSENSKYRLDIIIKKFLHKIDAKNNSYVLVDIKFILQKDNKIIGIKEYNINRQCSETTPYGAIYAFNKVISYILDNLQIWIQDKI